MEVGDLVVFRDVSGNADGHGCGGSFPELNGKIAVLLRVGIRGNKHLVEVVLPGTKHVCWHISYFTKLGL